MSRLGLWSITEQGPRRILESEVDLERHLEAWIEGDPSLLRAGLTIVARQLQTEAGRLDLLALDPQGRWILIEVKRGSLRRETIAQVVDYASCISSMPGEELAAKIDQYLEPRGTTLSALLEDRDASESIEPDSRELQLFIVGTSRSPGLERIVSFLTYTANLSITLVTFDVFEADLGHRVLVRELTEREAGSMPQEAHRGPGIDDLIRMANAAGLGEHFKALLRVPQVTDVYARPYKHSVMFTPPNRRDRMLFTAWTKPVTGRVKIYVSPAAISEFYPVSVEEGEKQLASEGFHLLDVTQAQSFASAFIRMVGTTEGLEEGGA